MKRTPLRFTLNTGNNKNGNKKWPSKGRFYYYDSYQSHYCCVRHATLEKKRNSVEQNDNEGITHSALNYTIVTSRIHIFPSHNNKGLNGRTHYLCPYFESFYVSTRFVQHLRTALEGSTESSSVPGGCRTQQYDGG